MSEKTMRVNQRKSLGRLQQIFAALVRRKRLQEAIRDLQSLDDNMLNDIGIGRGDIEWIVDGGRRNNRSL